MMMLIEIAIGMETILTKMIMRITLAGMMNKPSEKKSGKNLIW